MKHYYLKNLKCPSELPLVIHESSHEPTTIRHAHDYTEIVLVRHGKAVHVHYTDDNNTICNSVIRGDIFVIQKGKTHAYTDCSDFYTYNVCIANEYLESMAEDLGELKFFNSFFVHKNSEQMNLLHMSPAFFSDVEEKLQNLNKALYSKRPSFRLAVKTAMIQFFLTAFDGDAGTWSRQPNKQINENIFRAISQIESKIEDKFDLTKLAYGAAMSVSGFAHKFKEVTGVSPGDYLIHLRLDKARKLLEESDCSLSEIAVKCGFYDSNYLIRVFKKRFGLTPKHYRDIHLQKKTPVSIVSQ